MSTTHTPRRLTRAERDHYWSVISYMKAIANAAILRALNERRKNCDATWEALWDGEHALLAKAKDMAEHARNCGQLLFCFPETTLLQGGAA